MAKVILAINAGSSSVKISVYSVDRGQTPKGLAEIQVSGLTAAPAKLKYTRGSEAVAKSQKIEQKVDSQDEAFKFMLDRMTNDQKLPQISDAESISHACHRIVHGGDYTSPQRISPSTIHHLEELTSLAPLHNGPALSILRTCLSTLPRTTNVAFFDTLFHSTLPNHIRTYAIDQEVARAKGLRKYGFHGISYEFITRNVAAFLGKDVSETCIIACHLGSGASVCAVRGGKSVDTSMGLTPLDGLPGATRSGSVDPSLIFHYASHVSNTTNSSSNSAIHITQAESILNKSAGWAALTGTTDFSRIVSSATSKSPSANDVPNASLAFELFTSRLMSFIGSYYVTLSGNVDALVFAGGIGEASPELRRRVVQGCACLGFVLDESLNSCEALGGESTQPKGEDNEQVEDKIVVEVTAAVSKHRILVCRTDEQAEMARKCAVEPDLGLFD